MRGASAPRGFFLGWRAVWGDLGWASGGLAAGYAGLLCTGAQDGFGGLSGAGVLVEGRRAGGAAGGAGEAWRGVRDWPSQALREGGAERPRSGLRAKAQGEAQDAPVRAALANGQDSRDLDCPSGCGARWPGEMASSGARGTLAMRLGGGVPATAGGSIPWGSARIMWGAGNAVCVKRSIFAEMETSDAAV